MSIINKRWVDLTIRKKVTVLSGIIFFALIISICFSLWCMKFSVLDFRSIMDKNVKTNNLVNLCRLEKESFATYVRTGKDEDLYSLQKNMRDTRKAVDSLSIDRYSENNLEEYARIQEIGRAYRVYSLKRDEFMAQVSQENYLIMDLYEIYDMQTYLIKYAESLMNLTIVSGNESYQSMLAGLNIVPELSIAILVILFLLLFYVSKAINSTIVGPVLKLAHASKKIAENDFFIEDVVVDNKDEIGELVHAFNKMKYATGVYISALEDQREAREQLHNQELEKLEMEKQLDQIHLELLKNQIKPHFLFNTLNVIAGMANLENADITEKMIKALSNIFRYNLKTPDTFVPLIHELEVLEDYMYLQQMRFGKRVDYSIKCDVDKNDILVPSFLLQPLAENAIIHGITPKENGGKVHVHIWIYQERLHISVNDNGVGMNEEQITALREQLKNRDVNSKGIGINNVYQRIKSLYPNSRFEIYSRKDEGTLIDIEFPIWIGNENENTDS